MYIWLPIHVEIPAEHPVVHVNYAWSKFFHNCKLHVSSLRADEQSTPRALGAYDKCQYRFHSIIHVNARCFRLLHKFETVHMCAIESTGHPEEACSLQPKFLNEVKCFHDNYWNGQPLPDYSKQTNYTLYTWSMH